MEVISTVLWVYGATSWCMCFYIAFASCEGLRWFSMRRNPFLVAGAAGALLVCFGLGQAPPCAALFITAWGWSCYALLVSLQYCRVRLFRRHVIPVNIPLALLVASVARKCG
jgi:hypothetical protein